MPLKEIPQEESFRRGKEVRERLEQTNWWIITGGPGTGKTTLLEHLAQRGYRTMPEAARLFIDAELAKGRSVETIRGAERRFQYSILRLKEKIEDETPTDQLILWDRGLHGDSAAYFLLPGIPPALPNSSNDIHEMTSELKRQYKGILLLDRLPIYSGDYARIEDENRAARTQSLIKFSYRFFGYEPIRVPTLPIEARAQFVIDQMRAIEPSVPDLPPPPSTELQLAMAF